MRLTVVGSSGSMSGPASPSSCYLVQAEGPDGDGGTRTWTVVLDLGSGAMGALLNYVDPDQVDLVAITHMHADHMVDLIGMHVYRRWHPDGVLPPVPVLAPAGALERVRCVGGDDESETYEGEFTFLEHTPGRPVTVGPMRVESFPVEHPVPAFGVRVVGPSSVPDGPAEVAVAYTGDTDSCEGVLDLARTADILLSEAAFQEGRDTVRGVHLTGCRAGQMATEGGARRLVLTHLQPWTDPQVVRTEAESMFAGPVDIAVPGAGWTI